MCSSMLMLWRGWGGGYDVVVNVDENPLRVLPNARGTVKSRALTRTGPPNRTHSHSRSERQLVRTIGFGEEND